MASHKKAIAAGATSPPAITATRLGTVLVSQSGTNEMTFTDGSSGPIVGKIPANAPVGYMPPKPFNAPISTSITPVGNAGNPAVTVQYEN